MALPDVLIVGSPKAGSTALHAALAGHPQLFAASPKEPKYFMCADAPPDPAHQRGPGDAHSAREWIWQRDAYERLFAAAPAGALKFESTPFYLWDRQAQLRIAATLPDVKLIAVVRDPLDRAFSNWTHLWADGLEPESDFHRACRLEDARVEAGWAPFWRYLELGRYGEQLQHLFTVLDPERVRVIRYRQLVDQPAATLDDLCVFLGVDTGRLDSIPGSNVTRWAPHTSVNSVLRRAVRSGAWAGQHVPPHVWRRAERHLIRALQRGRHQRPHLDTEVREQLVESYREDNALLGEVLKADFSDWLAPTGRGTYTVRRS